MKVGSRFLYSKTFMELGSRVGSSFLLDPTRTTSIKPRLQKCRHVNIHVILGMQDLGPHVKAVGPNFHALNGRDCMDRRPRTWEPVWNRPLS